MDITSLAATQWQSANQTVTNILQDAPNNPQKGTADSRYLWPTVVFEKVCNCIGNFGGVDCMECDFGWSGSDCNTRKTPVIRRSFGSLSEDEKQIFVNATRDLKNEMGIWSVIVEEPQNYSSAAGTVKLQNITTYNLFVYLHNFVARDDSPACSLENDNITIDFAHAGPVFPLWHRHYMLVLEKEYQRITGDNSFGFPYWNWEENDLSMFSPEYYGIPDNTYNATSVNVTGQVINPDDWNTVCDIAYRSPHLNCSRLWSPCNPATDLTHRRPLQRGGTIGFFYLPNIIEVMIAIAAPSYDAADANGQYSTTAPRTSFRSRLEGWNIICSAVNCTGAQDPLGHQHMHNNVHNWVGGQMDVVPAAVNDPIFNLHHANVDRVLESWIQRFANGSSNPSLLPAYVPVSGGHPGHNRDDYIVPFFPLITPRRQYRIAEEYGYRYDNLIQADIKDEAIPDCNEVVIPQNCPICDANSTCINCTSDDQMCPAPTVVPPPTSGAREDSESDFPSLPLGLGLGLGVPLLVAIAALLILTIYIICAHNKKTAGTEKSLEMTART